MKVKVTKTIVDKDILDDAIEKYDTDHRTQIAYLIMNTETAKILNDNMCEEVYPGYLVKAPLGIYRGSKVLIDESLEFGEVDVR